MKNILFIGLAAVFLLMVLACNTEEKNLSVIQVNGKEIIQCDLTKLGEDTVNIPLSEWVENCEIVSYDFFQNIKDNYTFIIYHPLDLKEQLEEALETNTDMSDEIRNRVLTMKNSLNENDNDILVICKFKQ